MSIPETRIDFSMQRVDRDVMPETVSIVSAFQHKIHIDLPGIEESFSHRFKMCLIISKVSHCQ